MNDAELSIADPVILSGVLFGAMLPYMFAALTMISVGKAAAEIIQEVSEWRERIEGWETKNRGKAWGRAPYSPYSPSDLPPLVPLFITSGPSSVQGRP